MTMSYISSNIVTDSSAFLYLDPVTDMSIENKTMSETPCYVLVER